MQLFFKGKGGLSLQYVLPAILGVDVVFAAVVVRVPDLCEEGVAPRFLIIVPARRGTVGTPVPTLEHCMGCQLKVMTLATSPLQAPVHISIPSFALKLTSPE